MELFTKRLLIRSYKKKDFKEVEKLLNDPVVMKYSKKGPINDLDAKKYIETYFISPQKEGLGLYPILLQSSHRIIGFAGLLLFDSKKVQGIELGYRLSPKYWGKGYAKEASLAFCEYAQNVLDIKDLLVIINPKNIPSMHLAKSLGFKIDQYMDFKDCQVVILKKELTK